ncbi:MAG: cupin domain-containing protein [Burkholderiaceae bacterium]
MDIDHATPLLGGLTARTFMRRHWQKKPLLVRGAIDPVDCALDPAALFELARRDDVRSRLIVRRDAGWTLRHGPVGRRALPPRRRPGWTLLVQGLDRERADLHALLARFRFVPQARLDDVMVSYASDQGGVGPHVDSYDVFLIQLQGQRRWRIGRVTDPALVADVPLKILRHFEPESEWLLEPGDLLYLPPRWAHDGVAQGECLTASIGFRAPQGEALAREVMQRMLDAADDAQVQADDVDAGAMSRERDLYRDPDQDASLRPGRIPAALDRYARDALRRLAADPRAAACALGELLSEPAPEAVFRDASSADAAAGVQLDRSTRMLYDRWHVYINGVSFLAGGSDAALMRRLADRTRLSGTEVAALDGPARELLDEWLADGWLQPLPTPVTPVARSPI